MEQEKYGFGYFFRCALTDRYGAHALYYHPRHVICADGGLEAGAGLPWWSWMVFWASRMNRRWTLLNASLNRVHGWMRYEEDYGLGADCDKERPWWKCPKFAIGHFYVFKTILCIIFCTARGPKSQYFHEWVNIACWDFHPTMGEYSGTDWDALDVGHGIFRNWFIRDYSDSSC
jgi:hypothetical protein